MMNSSDYRGKFFQSCVVLLGLPLILAAQNPVAVETAESVDFRGGDAQTGDPTSASLDSETFYQLQVMQKEMRELRGMIEELNHELAEMKRLQENRYLDVDARLVSLTKGDSVAATRLPENKPIPTEGPLRKPGRSATEDGLYETALSRIRIREYDGAIADLKQLLETYPEGSFAPNAYYWLGEVYAAKPQPEYENARRALAQLISFFPDHRKVPDALFKLGKVNHLMGDCERAGEILGSVVEKYPGTSVARLAEEYQRIKLLCE